MERFFSDDGRYALLVDGARQVGKTFIIEDFARRRYENFIEINFVKTPSAKRIFENVEDENDILEKLSTFSRKGLIRGKTLVFLDEVQECPEAVTYIKFLVQDGTCHYILRGSLLGVELKNVRSVPVGFMDEVKMYPLDFEEFVLANGEREELIAAARKSWEERRPLDRLYHERLSKLFRLYLVVGGMPAAVQRYLDTHDISAVVKEQEQILVEYRKDITKYDKENSLRIREVFERIAPELNKKNKRFYVNSVKPGERTERLEDEFVYASREHGEIDIVLEMNGKVLPVEVKSGKHYKRHRALNRVMSQAEYGIKEAIVFDESALH